MSNTDTQRPIEILLVEDNASEVRLTREALKESQVPNHLSVVGDGAAAMAFLGRSGEYGEAARPDIILLDFNLPKMNGAEVLEAIKGDPHLKTIPVVVMTNSGADGDVRDSYRLHANCFIKKPVDLEGFLAVMKAIEDFWLNTVRLPPRR